MIAVDASAMVEALIGRDADPDLLDVLAGDVDAPHLLDVEVLSALRGLVLGGKLDAAAAESARQDHFALTVARHERHRLADRIWQLRHYYTSYDASYQAWAEALDVPLFTCDARLAGVGHGAGGAGRPANPLTCRDPCARHGRIPGAGPAVCRRTWVWTSTLNGGGSGSRRRWETAGSRRRWRPGSTG